MKETDAIFQNVTEVHRRAARSGGDPPPVLRCQGPRHHRAVLRGAAQSRRARPGAGPDHDFKPWGKLTPFGIFLPDQKKLNFYFTSSKVTSDFIADRLEQWWQGNRERYPRIRQVLLDLDNGPEIRRQPPQPVHLLSLVRSSKRPTDSELIYYPPYHSKYNPIERCWGVLEVYWNGELLDSEAAVLGFAANMTYAGRHPQVDRVSATYCSGVRRSNAERKLLEGRSRPELAQVVGDHCPARAR